MITIYKDKKDIPQSKEYVELNDVFFNKNTVLELDNQAKDIIERIDATELDGKFKIKSKFSGVTLDVDCLSTGCKTALNVFYFPEKVFCLKECGDNALEVLYAFKHGSVYSDYALMPFDMTEVQVCSGTEKKMINDYEELKEWWSDEE
ncbi:MAG: DUF4869 domain-containing protein [Lachnospiraceae bacterium]|nr:DUF4869 domain-containing protein [Lachnospiraceae bacterium]